MPSIAIDAACAVRHWEFDAMTVQTAAGPALIFGLADPRTRQVIFKVGPIDGRETVRQLLVAAARQWGRAPNAILTDSSSSVTNALLALALSNFGIEHWLRDPCAPQRKTLIERLFCWFRRAPIVIEARDLEDLQTALDALSCGLIKD